MEDMSIEFSRMLRETLEKMQERIELQQWDNESDPTLLKKMKDLSELYSGWAIHPWYPIPIIPTIQLTSFIHISP